MIRNWFARWFRAPRRPIRNNLASSNRARLREFHPLEDRTVPSHVVDVNGIDVYNLTTVGATVTVNGAEFAQVSPQPTGTGVIDPFVRIQRSPSNPSGMEHGYNTDGIEEFDTKDAGGHNWNHSLLLSDLLEVNGSYQFTLDINETKPGTLLSLDELQVFVQGAPNLTGATFDGNGTIISWKEPVGKNGSKTVGANLVYEMDGGANGDSSVMLNYFLNRGSGSGDMTVLIPKSLFPDLKGKQYVYLYSKFGQYSGDADFAETDPAWANLAGAGAEAGFEEWTALVKRGQVGPFSISGAKYNDLNGDGNIIGDPTLSGWTINLYRESNNTAGLQVGPGGDTFVAFDVTDEFGAYSFANLAAGFTYYTTEVQQDGWTQTYGGNAGNNYYTTVLNSDAPDLDFGNFNLIDLTGTKYVDTNGNGMIDEGEVPSEDTEFTFELYSWKDTGDGIVQDSELTFLQSTDTVNGVFSFTGLAPLGEGEQYLVREAGKDGWVQTLGGDQIVAPTSGNDQDDLVFLNFELFEISGVKYRDINKDGVKDADEPLLSGWTINLYLDANMNGILDDAVFATTVTGAGGSYSFFDLGPGTYFVREVQQDNWQQFSVNPGPITGNSGDKVENVDFGNALVNPGVGRTKGFWHNQNGNAIIQNQLGGWDHVAEVLATLNLRDQNGELFFATDRTIEEFNDYLTNASNASNMVTQLSVQLAAAYLNAWAGSLGLTQEGQSFASFDTLLSVPTSISANGYISVGELIEEAALVLHGNDGVGNALADYDLIEPSPERTYANLLMTALDNFNNSTNIVNA